MLVALRFVVPETGVGDFLDRARAALAVLASRPGYRRGQLGRAYDDITSWSLVMEWESVGAYRRALGAYEVKMHATALLAQAVDEPSAFEPLVSAEPGGEVVLVESDRAVPGRPGPPGPLPSRP